MPLPSPSLSLLPSFGPTNARLTFKGGLLSSSSSYLMAPLYFLMNTYSLDFPGKSTGVGCHCLSYYHLGGLAIGEACGVFGEMSGSLIFETLHS